MNLWLFISVCSAVLAAAVRAQNPVPIRFQTDPVLVQTGTDITFTLQTVPDLLLVTWSYPGGNTPLAVWAGGNGVVNPVPQYQGRVSITATQLRISSAQLRDAGNYTVEVNPSGSTGLATNSRSVQLRVFDAVGTVRLFVPSVAIEGGNISLSCTWTAGTETAVQWSKGGTALIADARISMSGGSLVIDPGRRSDAGEYTCTVSNPVSARTARQSLTVYYGPDTPTLTTSGRADCVGGGDAVTGQTLRLTCASDSLPPALFSWQHDGGAVAAVLPGSGELSIQAFSSNQSGRYTCLARNSITGGTSERAMELSVIDVCLSGGEVAGIVIGCVAALFLILLLILLLVRWRRADRRRRDSRRWQKTDPNPGLTPPDQAPGAAGGPGRGLRHLHPPLRGSNPRTPQPSHPYGVPRGGDGGPRAGTPPHSGRSHGNGLPHNGVQRSDSLAHNGVDNPGFTRSVSPAENVLPGPPQRHNPNILIQAGGAQGGTMPPTVHVNLNTLPQTAGSNNAGQLPTVHVNLNSYPPHVEMAPQALPHRSAPGDGVTGTGSADQSPSRNGSLPAPVRTDPRLQSGLSHPVNPPEPSGLIPTGYTHASSQRNANTQTYRQDRVPNPGSVVGVRAGANSVPHGVTRGANSHGRQMPWDLYRGTPAYPNGTVQGGQTPRDSTSESSDYTSQNPTRPFQAPHRTEPEAHGRTASRSRAAPRRDAAPSDRQSRSVTADPGANIQGPNNPDVTRLDRTPPHTHMHTHRAGPEIRAAPGHAAPLSPRAPSPSRQPVPAGGVTPRGALDTRALSDPNHLPQPSRVQAAPPGLGPPGAQRPDPPAQLSPARLTHTALEMHTQRTQTFQNRNQQTQATLLHPGTRGAAEPPTPPPAIHLAQFQALPKEHDQHRALHPHHHTNHRHARPPVNVPTAQRHHAAALHTHPQHHQHHHRNANVHGPRQAHGGRAR